MARENSTDTATNNVAAGAQMPHRLQRLPSAVERKLSGSWVSCFQSWFRMARSEIPDESTAPKRLPVSCMLKSLPTKDPLGAHSRTNSIEASDSCLGNCDREIRVKRTRVMKHELQEGLYAWRKIGDAMARTACHAPGLGSPCPAGTNTDDGNCRPLYLPGTGSARIQTIACQNRERNR